MPTYPKIGIRWSDANRAPSSRQFVRVETFDGPDHVRIAIGNELAVEPGEKGQHRPVICEYETCQLDESRTRSVLDQHTEQLNA